MQLRKSWPALLTTLFLAALSSGAAPAGPVPNILIWLPDDAASETPAALLADLGLLGEDAVITDDLFAYSSDLSAHEIVMAIPATAPDTHVIDETETMGRRSSGGGLWC